MKLSHLSLAILSAIALAACGGGSSDQVNPVDHNNKGTETGNDGSQDQGDKKETETPAEEDAEIVDPTGDNVVDAINLAETSTTASQQYLRSADSEFDKKANPNQEASATSLSGISLDVQNPSLTNIVVARVEGKNGDGKDVKVAQFAGSSNSQMGSLQDNNGDGIADGLLDPQSLQGLNWVNAQVGSRSHRVVGTYVQYGAGAFLNPLFDSDSAAIGYATAYNAYIGAMEDYQEALDEYRNNPQPAATLGSTGDNLVQAITAVNAIAGAIPAIPGNFSTKYKIRNANAQTYTIINPATVDGNLANLQTAAPRPINMINQRSLAKYGAGLFQFSYNNATAGVNPYLGTYQGWGDVVNAQSGEVTGTVASATVEGGPTTGLVGIWTQGPNNQSIARGTDDVNIRDTRVFGHFYQDPGLLANNVNQLAPEADNAWRRPATFITGFDSSNKPNQYGLGAEPMVLNNVQYGRVTAELEGLNIDKEPGTVGWRYDRQNTAARDPEKLDAADDFYFYRGTNATTIAQMDKLPDTKIKYQGHALMYGIDNSFHGDGQNLPNSFGSTQNYGLGNFVDATYDVGNKELSGYVYNAWHNQEKKNFVEDKLVTFSGKVTGNTAIGEAQRTYVTETRPADFRASFFGSNANELGGAFNSVKREDPYGPITWGGVFGAKRVSSSDNAWLVSSEKQ